MIQWKAVEPDAASPARIFMACITGVGDAPFDLL